MAPVPRQYCVSSSRDILREDISVVLNGSAGAGGVALIRTLTAQNPVNKCQGPWRRTRAHTVINGNNSGPPGEARCDDRSV